MSAFVSRLQLPVWVVGLLWMGHGLAQTPSQHQFSFPSGVQLDNNPALSADSRASVWVWRANPQYTFVRQQANSSWSLTASANIERSTNTTLSDHRNDPAVSGVFQQQGVRSNWSLEASAAQSSTRATELEATGIVTLDRTQTTASASWGAQYLLSERWTLSGGVEWRDIRYDTLALVENRTTSASVGLGYGLSDRETLALQGGVSHYQPGRGGVPGLAQSSINTNLTANYTQEVSPTLEWGARLGLVRITGANADTSWQGGVSLTYQGPSYQATLDAGRNVTSSGLLGGFATNHAVRGNISYALSDRSRIGASVAYTRNVGNAPTRDSSTTWGLNASTDLTPFWQLAFSLQQRQAKRTTGNARGTLLGIHLVYTHPDW
jgi:hypothetical protein